MTLPERSAVLAEKLARLGQSAGNQLFLDRLKERQKSLIATSAALQRAVIRGHLLLKHGHLQGGKLPESAQARGALETLRLAIEADRNAITGETFENAIDDVRDFATRLYDLVNATWRELRDGDPKADHHLLEVAAKVGERKRVESIRSLSATLQAVEEIPSTDSDWKRFESVRDQLRSEIDELGVKNFPDTVLEFFRSVQTPQGAQLDLLTPEVKNWLEEKGFLGRLRIFLR